jgi:hypothetical protein
MDEDGRGKTSCGTVHFMCGTRGQPHSRHLTKRTSPVFGKAAASVLADRAISCGEATARVWITGKQEPGWPPAAHGCSVARSVG